MVRTLFSPSWYRVAQLRPMLRRQVVVHRHTYRGEPWHVIEDRSSEQHHRFKPSTYFLIGLMDGTRTVDAIWRAALDKLGDDAPSQDDMIGLLAQLSFADLLKTDASPEANQLFLRHRQKDRQKWLVRMSAPFAWRLPLFDPDRLLDVLVPFVRWIFSAWGLLVWLAIVVSGAVVAAINWGQVSDRVSERVLEPWNLAALALAYPLLKVLHELGHALAVKVWGGRVHDVGVMFILFMPIPYVDASASSSFASKWRRAVVDAAGIMVELFLAALALMAWLQTENPVLRTVLFNITLIGTVSTVLFNGNPLLKFDGYYILSDLIEVPNLAQRAQAYLGYLFRRYVFGVATARSPVTADGERFWFLLYGPLAALYRVFLTISIAVFLASQYMLAGLLLAVWSVALLGLMPLARLAGSIAGDPSLRDRRPRVVGALASIAALLLALAFAVPAPFSTVAEAVAFVPENRQVRAGADGFMIELLAEPGSPVEAGTRLAVLADPTVEAESRVLTAQMAALKSRLMEVEFTKLVNASVIRAEMKAVEEDLARVNGRRQEQTVVASAAGRFLVPSASDLPGRFVQRGTVFGFVHDPADVLIRAVLDQEGMGAVQKGWTSVSIWQAGNETRPVAARLERTVPGGRNELPHKALSTEGGGAITLDPRAPDRLRTIANVFQVDLRPAAGLDVGLIGQRFLVRFEHAPRPIGLQLADRARWLILDRFGI